LYYIAGEYSITVLYSFTYTTQNFTVPDSAYARCGILVFFISCHSFCRASDGVSR